MKKLVLIAALSTVLAGSVLAQTVQNQACTAAVVKQNVALNDTIKAIGTKASPEIAGKIKKVDEAIASAWYASKRATGWTDKECADMSGLIRAKSAMVAEAQKTASSVAAAPQAPAANSSAQACLAEIKKVASEADKIFADGVAKKTINAKEAAAYKERDAALQKQALAAAADKRLSKEECDGLLVSANKEKAIVIRMATPSPVQICHAALTNEYQALLKDYDAGKSKIDPKEEAAYQSQLAALKRDWSAAQKDGISLEDCNAQRSKIKTVQENLNKMQAK